MTVNGPPPEVIRLVTAPEREAAADREYQDGVSAEAIRPQHGHGSLPPPAQLEARPKCGAELARAADILHRGIYVLLGRLEDAGLIEEHERGANTSPRRQRVTYRLTELGRRTLAAEQAADTAQGAA